MNAQLVKVRWLSSFVKYAKEVQSQLIIRAENVRDMMSATVEETEGLLCEKNWQEFLSRVYFQSSQLFANSFKLSMENLRSITY